VRRSKAFLLALLLFLLPKPASADLFGGDVVVLTQLLANALQQLVQLKRLLSTGNDTLDLMREVNRGIQDGLSTIQMLDPKFNPGLYGDLDTADRVLSILSDLYGKVPMTSEARLEQLQDQAASESIAMNGTLFQFADKADEETRRILAHADVVSPGGAAKLTAQSVAVLIGVSTQVLRTNSMMLKMMGQNMALTNRGEKLGSLQFKTQYEGLSTAIGDLPKTNTLPPLH
jgi:hypothetical protein